LKGIAAPISRPSEETLNTQTKLLITVLLIVIAAGPAYPQNRTEASLLRLEKDMIDVNLKINQLQTAFDRENGVLRGLVERMADQVNTLAAGTQKLNQSIDGIRTQNDATIRELRATLKTVTDSVKDLQSDVSSARSQINTISRELTAMKNTAEPLATPEDLWREANLNYNVGLWDLAISGLQEFLSKYPMDPKAPDAQLRIGDALHAQKKLELAVTQYDIVLQKYPESDTTRAALLKKGLVLAEANQPQATSTLNEVVKKFPGTSEALTAQQRLKELQSAQRGRTPAR
jgi:tol-pal system protein YbgF